LDVTTADIRRLVDRPVTQAPVTSVYLNTDGARYPKPGDYEARLDALLREIRRSADKLTEAERTAVTADVDAISRWVRNAFTRGDVRGIGVFASGGEVFENVQTALPVRNLWRVADRPYVVPLEALLGRSHHIALALVERDRARIFRYRLGRLEEYVDVASDVHPQHQKGGWSQLRFQKNIEHEALHHYKDTAEVLRQLHADQPLNALVIAGPDAEAKAFAKHLHPYVEQVVHGEPISLTVNPSAEDLREKVQAVEQELVSNRRSQLLQRLAAAHGQAEKAARGLRHVVESVNTKRVEVLFVVEGAGQPGWRSSTGALALHEDEARAYGEPVEPVEDLIDEIIEEAVRSGAQIELFRDEARLDGHPVAALLRF
jgi:peptide chain release factor subunit 1